MAQELFKVEKWKDWDIQIEAEPQSLESRTLDAPEIIQTFSKKPLHANDRVLK